MGMNIHETLKHHNIIQQVKYTSEGNCMVLNSHKGSSRKSHIK